MAKIGIMTFWESQNNYGQLLQGFALQKYLNNKGHDAFIIRFLRVPKVKKRGILQKIRRFNLNKYLHNRINRTNILFEKNSKPRQFDAFRNNMIFSEESYKSLDDLAQSPPDADIYICGSDQIWNDSFPVSCEPFLLDFGSPSVKRVAYAASFGKKDLKEESHDMFIEKLKNFDSISVREQSAVILCKELGVDNALWVPDPTLLFNKVEWAKYLEINLQVPKTKKQIFIYTLGNSDIKDRKQFIYYAKSLKDTEVIHATANGDFSGNVTPTINEWVKHISMSNFVITTSFHGMVFSIIFGVNFAILLNTGQAVGMNERIYSLLSKLGLEDHIMDKFDEDKLIELSTKTVDWTKVYSILFDWKIVADLFLEKSLN